jgi:hypothetical protein
MTNLTIPKGDQSVAVTIDDYCFVEVADAELQEHIEMLLGMYPVKPIVNREPWTARLLIRYFGGEIVSEPEFDPNLGDVRSSRKFD